MPQPPPIEAVSQAAEEKQRTEARPPSPLSPAVIGADTQSAGGLSVGEDLLEHVAGAPEEGELETGD